MDSRSFSGIWDVGEEPGTCVCIQEVREIAMEAFHLETGAGQRVRERVLQPEVLSTCVYTPPVRKNSLYNTQT